MQLGQGVMLWLRGTARRQGHLNGEPEPVYAYRRRVLSLDPVYDPDAGRDGDGEKREVWVESRGDGVVGIEGLSALEFLSSEEAELLGQALTEAAGSRPQRETTT